MSVQGFLQMEKGPEKSTDQHFEWNTPQYTATSSFRTKDELSGALSTTGLQSFPNIFVLLLFIAGELCLPAFNAGFKFRICTTTYARGYEGAARVPSINFPSLFC